jgi:hypothetical protein
MDNEFDEACHKITNAHTAGAEARGGGDKWDIPELVIPRLRGAAEREHNSLPILTINREYWRNSLVS